MIVLVVVLAAVAVATLAAALVTRARLADQRARTVEATERADAAAADAARRATEVTTTTNALSETAAELTAATAALADAHARVAEAEETARAAAAGTGLDADVLWTLERSRSERTWRFSVAAGPDSISALRRAGGDDLAAALHEALRIELEAAREEVGTAVELDAQVPSGITTAGAVLALRTAQELLADVVRRSESTTLRVSADGDDLEVAVSSVDDAGGPVVPSPLPLPPSPGIETIDAGVRLLSVIAADDGAPADDDDAIVAAPTDAGEELGG
jgi:hypothetical protein